MSNDRQIISYLSPADLVALMNQSGVIAIHETGMSDGKPVIHASVKVVNAQTGEQLPGGLPFSVVMFKGPNEPGYSNIAIGTIVPASELKVALPRDYFNFCNQRFRFTRTFPVDEHSFVIQMDLVLKNATREYVKFSFGLWSALFSQMVFELMGRSRESLIAAAEAYAAVRTDFAEQIATTPAMAETVVPAAEAPAEPESVMPLAAEEIVAGTTVEAVALDAEAPKLDIVEEVAAAVDAPQAEAVVEDVEAEEHATSWESDEIIADPVEGKDEPEQVPDLAAPELSIVAGPVAVEHVAVETVATAEPAIADQAAELAEVKTDVAAELATGEADGKDVMPA